MMERKIAMKKGTIEKKIPENLVSEYLHLGWKKKEEKLLEEKPHSFKMK